MKTNNEKYFKTTSFYLGAFLSSKGADFLKEKYNFEKNNESERPKDKKGLYSLSRKLKRKN